MPLSQEEYYLWMIIQGDNPERLDRIHKGSGAMRARLEAEGRGPSIVLESVSSDDEEFGDARLMTPPASPPWTPGGATSKENNFIDTEIQQPKLGNVPLQDIQPSHLSQKDRHTEYYVKDNVKIQCRFLGGEEEQVATTIKADYLSRITRSKALKTAAFYQLAHDNKTSQRVFSAASMRSSKSTGLKRPERLSS
ncbi:hypothetical protein MMC17_005541 [Xylographa soralifera]|nr:hypothetical protein [Xylographa soralifera]